MSQSFAFYQDIPIKQEQVREHLNETLSVSEDGSDWDLYRHLLLSIQSILKNVDTTYIHWLWGHSFLWQKNGLLVNQMGPIKEVVDKNSTLFKQVTLFHQSIFVWSIRNSWLSDAKPAASPSPSPTTWPWFHFHAQVSTLSTSDDYKNHLQHLFTICNDLPLSCQETELKAPPASQPTSLHFEAFLHGIMLCQQWTSDQLTPPSYNSSLLQKLIEDTTTVKYQAAMGMSDVKDFDLNYFAFIAQSEHARPLMNQFLTLMKHNSFDWSEHSDFSLSKINDTIVLKQDKNETKLTLQVPDNKTKELQSTWQTSIDGAQQMVESFRSLRHEQIKDELRKKPEFNWKQIGKHIGLTRTISIEVKCPFESRIQTVLNWYQSVKEYGSFDPTMLLLHAFWMTGLDCSTTLAYSIVKHLEEHKKQKENQDKVINQALLFYVYTFTWTEPSQSWFSTIKTFIFGN